MQRTTAPTNAADDNTPERRALHLSLEFPQQVLQQNGSVRLESKRTLDGTPDAAVRTPAAKTKRISATPSTQMHKSLELPPKSLSLSQAAPAVRSKSEVLERKKADEISGFEEEAFAPPIKSLAEKEIQKLENLPKKSFHEVQKVRVITDSELIEGFLKINATGSLVSQLEATASGFYKIFGSHLVPTMHAVYNNSMEYTGVLSETLPGFKSIVADPLKKEDLNVDFLAEKKLSIEEVDRLEIELRKLDEEEQAFIRKEKKLEHDLAVLKENKANEEKSENRRKISDNLLSQSNLSLRFQELYDRKKKRLEKIAEEQKITEQDIKRYRTVKNLAVTLTTSYIYMEDDLHRNNISKDGLRIDFDMSLWPIFYMFKAALLKSYRKPGEANQPGDLINPLNKFNVTARDIEQFPLLTDARPYYWVTRSTDEKSYASSTNTRDIFKSVKETLFPSAAENAYPDHTHPIYQSLHTNPVFIHHKFKTLLKYILTTEDVYRTIAKQHMDEFCKNVDAKPMIDVLVKQQMDRIEKFETELLKIPAFLTFFQQHSQECMDELLQELHAQGVDVDPAGIEKSRTDFLASIAVKLKAAEQKDSKAIPKADAEEKEADAVDATKNVGLDKSYFGPTMFQPAKVATPVDPKSVAQSVVVVVEQKKETPKQAVVDPFEKLKEDVVSQMNLYSNPTIRIPGATYPHKPFAEETIALCNSMKFDAEDKQVPTANAKALYVKLSEKLTLLKKRPEATGIWYYASKVGQATGATDRMLSSLEVLVPRMEALYPQLKTAATQPVVVSALPGLRKTTDTASA
jgi:hypothetical protein